MDRKGISPVIGAVLLVMLVVVLWALFSTWMHSYTSEQISKSEAIGSKQIDCSEAGITITHCTYDKGGTEVVAVTIENTGSVDLNGFKVIAMYSDYTSDSNKNKYLYLDVGASGTAYITANASKTVTEVKVVPLECDIISDSTTSCS